MHNELTLAVAGSRKTQGFVDHCATLGPGRRAAMVTYTQNNQIEVRKRLQACGGDQSRITVMGWFTFLLRDFARPFVRFKFREARVRGFNYEGRPARFAKGLARFLDSQGQVYGCELGRLAYDLINESQGTLVRRLECVYDEILIDEVQDLSGYDLEILDVLLRSKLTIRMVGDIRQAILSTNPRGAKNKQYAYADAIRWFREREKAGRLRIVERATTWRCRPEIAAFSDTIFDRNWEFVKTESRNSTVTEHDGVYIVHPEHVFQYVERYRPRCLRDGANSAKEFDLDYLNFGLAKGATFERVLIVPTEGIRKFVKRGHPLEGKSASRFYVAVTRAAQSVAIVATDPGSSGLPVWEPILERVGPP